MTWQQTPEPALAELGLRAGASDTDREAWLAARRAGVTATEVRDLFLKKVRQRDLIDRKLGLVDDGFTGNLYTEWGKLREPYLAATAESIAGVFPESRVFSAVDEERFLASPDGIGVDFSGVLVIGEYKTVGAHKDLTPGTPDWERTGYLEQMTWAMRVTGARRCLFIWEERIEEADGAFLPGRIFSHWIEYDESLAAQLEKVARRFLVALDKRRAEVEAGQVDPAYVDPAVDALAAEVLDGRAEEAAGKVRKERAWKQLQELLAERPEWSQRSSTANVSWTAPVDEVAAVVDEEAAKAAEGAQELLGRLEAARGELAAAEAVWAAFAAGFTKEITKKGRASLTVTQAKKKGEEG